MAPVFGVVGCGGISRFHFEYLQHWGATVGMVSDLRDDLAAERARQFAARHTDAWQDLVADPGIDAVICCLPSALHGAVVRAALEAGKHVICEKTLSLDASESRALGRLAEERGRCLYVNYMKRFFPAAIAAKQALAELGTVLSVQVRTHQPVPFDAYERGDIPDFFRPDERGSSPIFRMSGGGVLHCAGSHLIDMLVHLVGMPERVTGRRWTRPGHDVEFMFHGLLDLPGGAVGHLDCCWHPHSRVGFQGEGWDEYIEVIASGGRLRLSFPIWDQPERAAARLSIYREAAATVSEERFEATSPFLAAGRHFTEQIALGEQGPVMDAFAGYRVDAVIAALSRSAAEERVVAVPPAPVSMVVV